MYVLTRASAISLEAMHTKHSIYKMLIHLQAQYTS